MPLLPEAFSALAWPSTAIFLMCGGAFLITPAISSSKLNDASKIVALLTANWIFSWISILLSRTSTRGGGAGGGGGGGRGGGRRGVAEEGYP